MANTLKDALMKAGLRATQHENEREQRPKWEKQPPQKSVAHQERRNYCEVCNNVQPDVERYNHKNPLIDAQWICVACADKNMIEDRFRATHQSDFALRGLFRREYGPTRKAIEFERPVVKSEGGRDSKPGAPRGGGQRFDRNVDRGNERKDNNDQRPHHRGGDRNGNKGRR